MAKILSVYNRLQAGDYENGNGGKRRVSRLTQFIHATLQFWRVAQEISLQQRQTVYLGRAGVTQRYHGNSGLTERERQSVRVSVL